MKRRVFSLVLAGWCGWAAAAAPAKQPVFGYAYGIDDFANGLRLVTVPTEHANLVALYFVVRAGSRNEVEPGKTGYAHFFEHLMFRGSEHYTAAERDAVLKRAGAESNAYTSDDRTVFHEVFAKDDLESVMKIEADRFERLKYSRDVFKTESLAVLGEYNKNSANPQEKMFEAMRELAFKSHTYAHTTMGFIKDIEDFPNQYDYSWKFFDRYYRPENVAIIMVGDVTRERAVELTRRYFLDWRRGKFKASILEEPPQTGPRQTRLEWPSPTLPLVYVAFRGPAFSDRHKDKAALDLLAAHAFGENSELHQKLVLKEQKVDELDVAFENHFDPELFGVIARVKNPKDLAYVQKQILATCARFGHELIPPEQLAQTRSRLRYGFALSLDTPGAIAGALAEYVALGRSPEALNKYYDLFEKVRPQDIREVAARYLTDSNRNIVTVTAKPGGEGK